MINYKNLTESLQTIPCPNGHTQDKLKIEKSEKGIKFCGEFCCDDMKNVLLANAKSMVTSDGVNHIRRTLGGL